MLESAALGDCGRNSFSSDRSTDNKSRINYRFFRIDASQHPGWADLESGYINIPGVGEVHVPFTATELPHTTELRISERSSRRGEGSVLANVREGRYRNQLVAIDFAHLKDHYGLNGSASLTFSATDDDDRYVYGQLEYAGGSVETVIDKDNPVPAGTSDVEIPDYQHNEYGSQYGDYATTWFRIGHSGDRYLHPGRVSLGCVTVREISAWPSIWNQLIHSRKDNRSVGEIIVRYGRYTPN